MSSVKLTTSGGNGGTVTLTAPANTTSYAAVELTLPVDDGDANQYLKTDGLNIIDLIHKSRIAEKICRINRVPVFLHMKTVMSINQFTLD